MADENIDLVFVYGTLRTGFGNNRHFLRSATLKGRATIKGDLLLVDLGPFPALIARATPKLGGGVVRGEVWQVTPAELADLDRLEGVPDFYDRTTVQTVYGRAYTYKMTPAVLHNKDVTVCEDGLWRPSPEETEYFEKDNIYTRATI